MAVFVVDLKTWGCKCCIDLTKIILDDFATTSAAAAADQLDLLSIRH